MSENINTSTCTITSLSHDGRGIAHIEGKTTFISGALPGEVITYTYTRRHPSFDEATCLEISNPSPIRTTPPCPHYNICGGCSLQHIVHSAQLDLKQTVLLEQLRHIGNVTPQNVLPPLVGPIWHYRYKARLSVKYVNKKNKLLIGFHEKNGRFVADLHTCPVLHHAFSENIVALGSLITELENYQQIPQIEIACGDNDNAIVIRHLCAFSSADLNKLTTFSTQHNYRLFLQPHGLDSIHCINSDTELLSYVVPLGDDMCHQWETGSQDMAQRDSRSVTIYFKPTDFTQINYHINQQMINKVVELLAPQPNENILDLFCGIGNFTLPLATKCQFCVGVEGNATAIVRANFNAEQNKITNARFYNFDLTQNYLTQEWTNNSFDKIIIDPPRTGALECIKQLSKFNAKKIVYVSCNPATLARDCKELQQQGYTLTHTGIIDMFPHTSHVETIALLCSHRL